jgi:hypothetical protein
MPKLLQGQPRTEMYVSAAGYICVEQPAAEPAGTADSILIHPNDAQEFIDLLLQIREECLAYRQSDLYAEFLKEEEAAIDNK